jgi:hypothetical protein
MPSSPAGMPWVLTAMLAPAESSTMFTAAVVAAMRQGYLYCECML